jgi:hypothetical protein
VPRTRTPVALRQRAEGSRAPPPERLEDDVPSTHHNSLADNIITGIAVATVSGLAGLAARISYQHMLLPLPPGFVLPYGTPPTVVTAINWALAQLGTPYSFGGDCTNAHGGNPCPRVRLLVPRPTSPFCRRNKPAPDHLPAGQRRRIHQRHQPPSARRPPVHPRLRRNHQSPRPRRYVYGRRVSHPISTHG